MPNGKVLNWNPPRKGKKNSEGFGFVRIDGDSGDSDLFLYSDDIKDSKLRSEAKIFGLKNGTRIRFKIKEPASERKSRLAVEVEPCRDDEGGSSARGRGSDGDRSSRRSRSGRRNSPRRSRSPRRDRPPPRREDRRGRPPPRRGDSRGR